MSDTMQVRTPPSPTRVRSWYHLTLKEAETILKTYQERSDYWAGSITGTDRVTLNITLLQE